MEAAEATAAPAPVIRPRVGMSDGDMHAFLMHSLGIENCEYTAQQLFNAAKETLLWTDVRNELKLSTPSAMDLRTALLDAIKAATMGNSGGRSAAAPSGCVPEGPAAKFVNGVPTTDDDDARFHVASGKTKVAPAGGMFDLKSLKQPPPSTQRKLAKSKLPPPASAMDHFNLVVKKPSSGWVVNGRSDITQAAEQNFAVVRIFLNCNDAPSDGSTPGKFSFNESTGEVMFEVTASVQARLASEILIRNGRRGDKDLLLGWFTDRRYTNSPLNFLVAVSRHAHELRSMEDASSKTDRFEAEVMELMPGGVPAVHARRDEKQQLLRDAAAVALGELKALETAALESLTQVSAPHTVHCTKSLTRVPSERSCTRLPSTVRYSPPRLHVCAGRKYWRCGRARRTACHSASGP